MAHFFRRRLPHIHPVGKPVFLTWRLHGSLPEGRYFLPGELTDGQVFARMDKLLNTARKGPMYLRQSEVARLVVDSIHHCAEVLGYYELHAFVVMGNHVHILITPRVRVTRIMQRLKGSTARQANQVLGRLGSHFWQDESYDRVVRDDQEFNSIRRYIESDPVRSGLVNSAEEYPWSSAHCGITAR